MLELFQRTEKPPKPEPPISDQSGFDTSSPNHPPQNHQQMQNFGLMLAPPSQRQQQQSTKSSMDPDHHTPVPSSSSNSQGETNTENTDLQNRTPKEPAGAGANAGTMFKNVWTNVSTQPRNKILTPSMVQSMMLNRANSNINESNSAGTGTGQAEAGTSSASLAQEERQLFDKNALNAPVGSKRGLNPEENILHGRPLNANPQQNNYSLLNQVQTMRSTDLDAGNMNRLAKRLRPDHGGPVPPHVTDSNNNNNNNKDGMMNFVSREKSEEKRPAGAPSTAGGMTKTINPQMAPQWFEQYGNYRNGQNVPSVHESPKRTSPAPNFSFPKVPWNNLDNNNIKSNSININNINKMGSEQGMERSPVVTPISRFGPQTVVPAHNINNNISNNISNINNNNAVPLPRVGANEKVPMPPVQTGALTPPVVKEKRKTRKMVPFHKVTEVPESIISTSMAEMDWAQTANRLFDKVDEEAELAEEGQLAAALSKRRLVFTTKLTQHLVPAIPPRFLRSKADKSHESVVYFASNFALRDACSLVHANKSAGSEESNNGVGEKSAEKGGEQFFAKVVEASNGRFKKLEEDFIRLNKRTSVLDLQLECQELERFSIVNRLGRFHGRGQNLPDSSSDPSQSRPFFQRSLTPSPLPNNSISDPNNTHCLLL